MPLLENWFQFGPPPTDAIHGYYEIILVALSYLVACLASFVALDFSGRLQAEKNRTAKIYWLAGGCFAMGSGIWSMHFIGMLAFIMPMKMSYSISWTLGSLLVAVLASLLALSILQKRSHSLLQLIMGGVFIGLGISCMHYMGMEGMKNEMVIHYKPGLFFLSLLVGIGAALAALWLALHNNKGSSQRQYYIKVVSAAVMGVAICGMHYTGMEAAVFTPKPHHQMLIYKDFIDPNHLALFIAGITALIISLALIASNYYKKMVIAVQNEKEFLNAMLNNLEDGIIACDSRGNITVLNQTLATHVPFVENKTTIDDLPSLFTLYSDGASLQDQDFPFKKILKGDTLHQQPYTMRFKTGVMHEVVIDGQPIINGQGKKLGAVAVIHDVTDRKKTEKLKNEFVSIVSHELRTPLTSIKGALGLLISGAVGEFPDKAQKLVDIAHSNCERLLLLINDILDLEKIEAGKIDFKPKNIALDEVVAESIEANKMYAEKYGVRIECKKTTAVNIIADPDRLMQVLNNLLSNACKFSPAGESIDVSIETTEESVTVAVRDNGAGIPEEFQSRIFQKFAQADSSDTRAKGGTGLGLSISKMIIENFGGQLNFNSPANQGTTFYFTLPIAQTVAQLEKLIPTSNQERLLLCEDDIDQSDYLQALLIAANFDVDVAATIAQARALLERNLYKAVLLDLIMPDQDGISFIKEIRSSPKTCDLQIIVISAIAQTGQELLNNEAFPVADWLEKPIDFSQLLTSIHRIKKENTLRLPKIMHIEDDASVSYILTKIIADNAELCCATSLKEAIILLKNEKFDLIILDLLLPDGNGCDILPLITRLKIPVLVFSALKIDENYSKYINASIVKTDASNQTLLSSIMNLLKT